MTTDKKTLADVQPGGRVRLGDQPPFVFARFVNGLRMAEGVTIEKERNLTDAMQVAAKVASKGPNGEVPVLVRVAALSAQPSPPTCKEGLQVHPSRGGQDAAIEAMAESLLCAESSATLKDAREQAALLLADALPHLSAQPSPGGQGALVTDAMVEAAHAAYWAHPDDSGEDRPCMRAALEAALAARQPVGEPVVVAHRYIQRHQSAEHSVWLSGDADETYVEAERQGLGRIERAYEAPPARAADLGRFRKLASWVANCAGHGINDSQRRMGEELLALIDSKAVGNGQ
ncbi:hypothetical protein [Stenotrophomonas sp. T8]|uniref:hypothetical protein n=1 Tax=Stenotrophomonas sp. T8 TaxID=3446365 RepID=UPI003F6E8A7F